MVYSQKQWAPLCTHAPLTKKPTTKTVSQTGLQPQHNSKCESSLMDMSGIQSVEHEFNNDSFDSFFHCYDHDQEVNNGQGLCPATNGEDVQNYLYPIVKVNKNSEESTCSYLSSKTHSEPFENEQIPAFLRKLNCLNSVYYNPVMVRDQVAMQRQRVMEILKEVKKCTLLLYGVCIKIGGKQKVLKLFTGKQLEKKKDELLEWFMHSEWEKGSYPQETKMLKPGGNFKAGQLRIDEHITEYEIIIKQINKIEETINEQNQPNFREINRFLWKIEQRLLELSHSLYYEVLKNQYPHFYYSYLRILKYRKQYRNGNQKQQKQLCEELKEMLKTVEEMEEVKQPLTISQVGIKVKQTIMLCLNYN